MLIPEAIAFWMFLTFTVTFFVWIVYLVLK